MVIRFGIFDVGQVCYPYTLEPLDYLLQKRTVQKNISKKSGVRTFDYNPFMKGLIDFTQFCKDLFSLRGYLFKRY